MANTVIRLKKSSVTTHLPNPAQLDYGEIALNYADGKIFYKDTNDNIQQISGSANTFYTVNANGTYLVATSPSDILNINTGDNIEIQGNFLTDTITISANLKSVFDQANAAYDRANSSNDVLYVASAYDTANAAYVKANGATVTLSSTAPIAPADGNLWWNTTTGRMFIYFVDTYTSSWVETSPATTTIDIEALANTIYTQLGLGTGSAVIDYSNTTQVVDTYIKAQYRTAKYIIQATSNTSGDVQSSEVLLTHNDTDSFLTEYGTVLTGPSELYTVSTNVSSGNVNLIITTAFGNTTIDISRTQLVARTTSGTSILAGDMMSLSGTEDLSTGTGTEDLML